MKTFEETITRTRPQLIISREDGGGSGSPREWSNLGYWICIDREYNSPDNNESLISIVKDTGDEAKNQEEHIRLIKKRIEAETDEKVLEIYPTNKYEHGGIAYSLGEIHGFDYSNNGFYIITEKTASELGTEAKDFAEVIRQEIEVFNKWIKGEVYGFKLYNEQGEFMDSCGGFYSFEEIKANLPEDWKDENLEDYLID